MQPQVQAQTKRSPWLSVGLGCGGVLGMGVWFMPDPPSWAGTPGSNEAVRMFVSHFDPCQTT